jgi:predicted acetyltransferase
LELRNVTDEEFEQWVRVESRAYGNRLAVAPEVLRPNFDLGRSIAVFDEGAIVGGSHSHRLEMSVPGGTAIIAGVANVAVQPTHRRRGVMTRMMHHQLEDVHQRGEALAGLFSSESVIYGRFGYGVATLHETWNIERQHNGYKLPYESPGRIVFVDPADIGKELPDVFHRSTDGRAGVFERSAHRWERDSQAREHREGGQGGLFYAAYIEDGRIDGYATYRTASGTLTINELMTTTREAGAALWRFCFDTDLIRTTEAVKRPLDDSLPWMLADPRRLQRSTRDGLWLRLVDVAAALELRSYMEPGNIVLEVRDDTCNWNHRCFQLEAFDEGASCRPSESSPDLTLSASALASAYLGGVSFTTLFGAGLVDEHSAGALRRADRMFAVHRQPWTPYSFG